MGREQVGKGREKVPAPVQLYGGARIGGLGYGERLDPPAVLGMSLIIAAW
jgi:hypothetical protein